MRPPLPFFRQQTARAGNPKISGCLMRRMTESLRLAALFSGGKDSAYAVYRARQLGHETACLVTVAPKSPESMLLHHPGMRATAVQARAMGLPQRYAESPPDPGMELAVIHAELAEAKREYEIDGIVHGGILSRFQYNAFAGICSRLDLEMVSPIWQKDQAEYMRELLENRFRFIITSVASDGLDGAWLGREITQDSLPVLESLAKKFGFNQSFEGGEAETFVLDCPLFVAPISVTGAPHWDGYRGKFEIKTAEIDYGARQPQRRPEGGH